jgi:dTDP-4-amino-4,6-dideoxygalactose transaminase
MLERLDAINDQRKTRAQRFITAMAEYPELVFQVAPEYCGHSWHLLAARYDGAAFGKTRDDLIALLAFTYGIRVVVQYYPLYRYPMFVKAGFGEAACPETDRFFDNMISFPFQQWMPEEQFAAMIEGVSQALERLRIGE